MKIRKLNEWKCGCDIKETVVSKDNALCWMPTSKGDEIPITNTLEEFKKRKEIRNLTTEYLKDLVMRDYDFADGDEIPKTRDELLEYVYSYYYEAYLDEASEDE